MKVLNQKPKCHNPKCENDAITLVSKMWLCGPCVVKLQDKVDKIKEKILIEEDSDEQAIF
jgi:hypothetical protein